MQCEGCFRLLARHASYTIKYTIKYTTIMKATKKNNDLTIEMTTLESVISTMILQYVKDDYFKALDEAEKNGVLIIDTELIKEVFIDLETALKTDK